VGTVLQIDIIHVDPEKKDHAKVTVQGNMIIVSRILLEPESSCEHEILVAHKIMEALNNIHKEVISDTQKAFEDDAKDQENGSETIH